MAREKTEREFDVFGDNPPEPIYESFAGPRPFQWYFSESLRGVRQNNGTFWPETTKRVCFRDNS